MIGPKWQQTISTLRDKLRRSMEVRSCSFFCVDRWSTWYVFTLSTNRVIAHLKRRSLTPSGDPYLFRWMHSTGCIEGLEAKLRLGPPSYCLSLHPAGFYDPPTCSVNSARPHHCWLHLCKMRAHDMAEQSPLVVHKFCFIRQWHINQSVRSPVCWLWVCNYLNLRGFAASIINHAQCILSVGVATLHTTVHCVHLTSHDVSGPMMRLHERQNDRFWAFTTACDWSHTM